MTTEELAAQEFWDELRKTTQARIGLGRAGNALPTRQVLELAAAHAAARDAVHEPLDVESFITEVRRVGIGEPAVVRSRATSRAEYLRRPDLGRLPEEPMQVPDTPADIGFVLADGLSPYTGQARSRAAGRTGGTTAGPVHPRPAGDRDAGPGGFGRPHR